MTARADWPRVGDPSRTDDTSTQHDCPATDALPGAELRFYCTRDAGHEPPHVAEGLTEVLHVWPTEPDGGA